MDINEIKRQLDSYFEIEKYPDDGWDFNRTSLNYFEKSFDKNKLGLMLRNSDSVEYVYTATFPDEKVLDQILSENKPHSLLFTHHPKIWDSSMEGSPFREISESYFQRLKDSKISIYALHTPLDKNGEYSTSCNLAKALDFEILSDFYKSRGIYKGVLCKCNFKTVYDLENYIRIQFQHDIGHFYNGDVDILNGKVGIVSGGGMIPGIIDEMHDLGINTYITGAILYNKVFKNSVDFCNKAKKDKINVIIGSHHTTEKYACLKMIDYFQQLHLPSTFIHGDVHTSDWAIPAPNIQSV